MVDTATTMTAEQFAGLESLEGIDPREIPWESAEIDDRPPHPLGVFLCEIERNWKMQRVGDAKLPVLDISSKIIASRAGTHIGQLHFDRVFYPLYEKDGARRARSLGRFKSIAKALWGDETLGGDLIATVGGGFEGELLADVVGLQFAVKVTKTVKVVEDIAGDKVDKVYYNARYYAPEAYDNIAAPAVAVEED